MSDIIDFVKVKILQQKFIGYICLRLYFWIISQNHNVTIIYNKASIELAKCNRKIIISNSNIILIKDLILEFETYYNYVVPELRGDFFVVDYSKPKLHKLKKSDLEFYFSTIPEEELVFDGYLGKYRLKSGDIVFDCGAYCGVSTYFFSKLVGEAGKVYAFEPDEKNYIELLKNIKMHNLKNVIPIKKGIYGSSTTLNFNAEGSISSAISNIVNRGELSCPVSIDVLSLEDAYKSFGISKLDFVKMDIEGAEVDVIKGGKDFLKITNTNFAIASYHKFGNKQTYQILEEIFKEINYHCETGYKKHLTTWAWKCP